MRTVAKALSVLDLFSESQPNLGLSEISRQLGWDKSNVRRYVSDLAARGILEQDPRDKSYFLGPVITRLAMLRDRTHPIAAELRRVLVDLVEATGETAHASTLVGNDLMTTDVVETKIRDTRVYIDPAASMPFHASGSGIAFLSASPDERMREIVAAGLVRFTSQTPMARSDLMQRIIAAQEQGYAKMSGSYESDIVGIAAPIIGFNGNAVGAVAVATPTARFNSTVETRIAANVKSAAGKVSRMYGARQRRVAK